MQDFLSMEFISIISSCPDLDQKLFEIDDIPDRFFFFFFN